MVIITVFLSLSTNPIIYIIFVPIDWYFSSLRLAFNCLFSSYIYNFEWLGGNVNFSMLGLFLYYFNFFFLISETLLHYLETVWLFWGLLVSFIRGDQRSLELRTFCSITKVTPYWVSRASCIIKIFYSNLWKYKLFWFLCNLACSSCSVWCFFPWTE